MVTFNRMMQVKLSGLMIVLSISFRVLALTISTPGSVLDAEPWFVFYGLTTTDGTLQNSSSSTTIHCQCAPVNAINGTPIIG